MDFNLDHCWILDRCLFFFSILLFWIFFFFWEENRKTDQSFHLRTKRSILPCCTRHEKVVAYIQSMNQILLSSLTKLLSAHLIITSPLQENMSSNFVSIS